MAGIGFGLEQLLQSKSPLAAVRAYLYAALIVAGPWLITIIVIGTIGFLPGDRIDYTEIIIFRGTVIYIYCFSLIVVGLIQMPLTRYLADIVFEKKMENFLPTYFASLATAGALQIPFVLTAAWFAPWSSVYTFHAAVLYLTVTFTWIAMIFLSAARDFAAIVFCFSVGALASVFGASYAGREYGITGHMVGYTAGQALLFVLLNFRIVAEFPSRARLRFDFLDYLRRYPALIGIGLLYSGAIWIDKLIVWYSDEGRQISGFIHGSMNYDAPMFVAYLTIIPALALFLIRIETSFYRHYRNFYRAIIEKKSLSVIQSVKTEMVASMHLSIGRLIKLQAIIALIAILAAPYLIDPLFLTWRGFFILRIGIIAAFLHVLLLSLVIIMLYFELQRETLAIVGIFFAVNALGTLATLRMDAVYHGYGYFTAAFVALVVGVIVFDRRMRDLEFITFTKQPYH